MEISYSDGSVWALGAPVGGKPKGGMAAKRDERFKPLLLADDEYLVQVRHQKVYKKHQEKFTHSAGRILHVM